MNAPIREYPRHVAIIMDGNGRWAQKRGLSRLEGHRAGAEAVRKITTAAAEMGLGYLTLYAFSVENWRRPKREIQGLMRYLKEYLRSELPVMQENNIRLRAIGRIAEFPAGVREVLSRTIAATAKNTGLTLTLALNYRGRAEIIDGVKKNRPGSAGGGDIRGHDRRSVFLPASLCRRHPGPRSADPHQR
ncbi:MAG: polyprenyl diphosphate synthase [PVC group bacterium]